MLSENIDNTEERKCADVQWHDLQGCLDFQAATNQKMVYSCSSMKDPIQLYIL